MSAISNILFASEKIIKAVIPDTVVNPHICPAVGNWQETAVICGTVVVCVLLGAVAVIACMKMAMDAKLKRMEENNRFDEKKRQDEALARKERAEREDRWRKIEHEWKEKEEERSRVQMQMKEGSIDPCGGNGDKSDGENGERNKIEASGSQS